MFCSVSGDHDWSHPPPTVQPGAVRAGLPQRGQGQADARTQVGRVRRLEAVRRSHESAAATHQPRHAQPVAAMTSARRKNCRLSLDVQLSFTS